MNNIEINDKLETDIENKYIKYKENVKFTTEEAIYILKRKDFCDEVENIAIENLIQENKELKEKLNDRVDVEQTANSISFTMPSKVVEKYMEVLDETALEIENKRLKKLIEKTEKDYIPKSKVKEKIEELNKQLEEDLQDERKVNSNRFIIICQCKNCLQELLEKRK